MRLNYSYSKSKMKILICIFSFFVLSATLYSQVIDLPYTSGFDNTQDKTGWTEYRTGNEALSRWSFNTEISVSAPACLWHDYQVGGLETDTLIDWYVSPAFKMNIPSSLTLSIYTAGFSDPTDDNLELWYSYKSGNPKSGDFQKFASFSKMGDKYTWADTTIELPFAEDTLFLALKYKTIGSAWVTYGIDNFKVEPITSVEDDNSKLNVYPNPFTSICFIELPVNIDAYEIKLLDIQGNTVKRFDSISGNKIALDNSDLPKALYILEVKTNSGTFVKKIYKME